MRYVLMMLALLTMTSCTGDRWDFWNTSPTIVSLKKKIDSQSAVNLVIDYSKGLEDKYGLFLEDSNFYYNDEIECIQLQYSTQAILTIKDARRLLVDMVENLLGDLDEDPVLGDKLKYPFKAKRLQIYIDCQSFFGLYVDPFYVSWIVLEEGMAYYYAYDVKYHGYDFWHSRIEPYFKSLQIVRAEELAEQNHPKILPQEKARALIEQYRGPTATPVRTNY